jgi:hypothetical protein
MLRDLMERAARIGRSNPLPAYARVNATRGPYRRCRLRKGRVANVKNLGFRFRWIPNATIDRFHGSWWTRMRKRAGVTG